MNDYPINMFERMYVVDGFYSDPDSVRNHALSLSRNDESQGNYAGVMTNDIFLTQEHIDSVSRLVGHKVKPSTPFTGKFRFTKQGDLSKQDIHFDPGDNNCAWASVVYLTPNVENTDGTIFWKHNRTGLEAIPRTLEGINQHGWKDTDDLKVFLDTDGMDHSLWTKTMAVPNRYNRLVMFRPWLFHSPGPSFGDNIETSRLIQTFFWSPV